ncbi:MAG TPA: glycoside hydrolase family 28 protein [Candidatus Sulfotelmatobacter sp.]|nr:glycoside hydrolase family 28 protein [Candidatus Sulfotelmatobacter sp.]
MNSKAGSTRRSFLHAGAAVIGGLGVVNIKSLAAAPQEPSAKGQIVGARSAIYDVRSFGAKGDGTSIDTPAINKAIETAAAAGGGTVVLPAGNYLCYTIHLKSNIALYLDQGATIVAGETGSQGQYDPAEPNQWDHYQDYGHSHWHNSLIVGEEIHDFSILGPGLIWGKGLSRGTRQGPRAEDPGVGNKAISLKNCHNVNLRDFSILHGGHFGILATGVDNFTIDNLKIDTNRDGIDVDCCSNVRISNCSVNSPWDDAICPKSSFALGYARPTENVTITNCFVSGSYMEGTLLDGTRKPFPPDERIPRNGRIKFGTESNGGFKRITVSNCVCDSCHGIALEAVDGALLEDVTIDNISMRNINNGPIFLRLGDRMRGPEGVPVGALRRVIISNIVCSDCTSGISSIITGLPGHLIEDVKLSNIIIEHRGGGTPEQAKREVPEEERDRYPEPGRFGDTPSNGFFIRHVKGIEMNDVKILVQQPDARPAFVLEDVHGADFFRIKSPKNGDVATFGLKNVEDFKVSQCNTVQDTHLDKVDNRKL